MMHLRCGQQAAPHTLAFGLSCYDFFFNFLSLSLPLCRHNMFFDFLLPPCCPCLSSCLQAHTPSVSAGATAACKLFTLWLFLCFHGIQALNSNVVNYSRFLVQTPGKLNLTTLAGNDSGSCTWIRILHTDFAALQLVFCHGTARRRSVRQPGGAVAPGLCPLVIWGPRAICPSDTGRCCWRQTSGGLSRSGGQAGRDVCRAIAGYRVHGRDPGQE